MAKINSKQGLILLYASSVLTRHDNPNLKLNR